MCNGNKKCAKCMAADGGNKEYNPKQIAAWINKYIYKGKATNEELKQAYTPTMVFLESKKLSFTGESISANADEIKVVINDPNYLEDKNDERSGWKLAALIIVFIIIWYWVFKEDGLFSSAPAASAAPPATPVYVAPPPAPVAPVAPVAPAAPATSPLTPVV